MECIFYKCNYDGKMEIRRAGPHIGPYCPRCGKWQGKWLKQTKYNLSLATKTNKEEL